MGALDPQALDPDPVAQFAAWYREAGAAEGSPEAMALATAAPDGRPSVRFVLLKAFDQRGFVFYTGYGSRKGRELEANPWAALAWYWHTLHRQVRVEGRVGRLSPEESDAYFRTRALGSQLGAWASPQSEVIAGRHVLEAGVAEAAARFAGGSVARPPGWGGYRLRPDRVEFWQGRQDRLHDRVRYVQEAGGGWRIERLAP